MSTTICQLIACPGADPGGGGSDEPPWHLRQHIQQWRNQGGGALGA